MRHWRQWKAEASAMARAGRIMPISTRIALSEKLASYGVGINPLGSVYANEDTDAAVGEWLDAFERALRQGADKF